MTEYSAPEPLILRDRDAWRAWLDHHEDRSDGVWLLLAKRGVTDPTALGYQEALVEALCSGWIDGQRRSRDESTYLQRFTPRRARSVWSQRNVELVSALIAEGRLRDRGMVEVERARADGRWDRAYAGPATAEVPAELTAALQASPRALRAFDRLTGSARYSVLHPVLTAATETTRERRIARAVARLEAEPEVDDPRGASGDHR